MQEKKQFSDLFACDCDKCKSIKNDFKMCQTCERLIHKDCVVKCPFELEYYKSQKDYKFKHILCSDCASEIRMRLCDAPVRFFFGVL